ncbi:hypothetical protein M3Y94_00665700 [Aphelenchoides besseyi]|nr:hypothetical protein M3Y94_00665700 [Aphelenchoides besseyi]KAI6231280.1 hypothetical protein M3Y95_00364800 [Aphelenchoides besseyi]
MRFQRLQNSESTILVVTVIVVVGLVFYLKTTPSGYSKAPFIDSLDQGFGQHQRNDGKENGSFVLEAVESVLGRTCRRNTGVLVQRMRQVQREINHVFQQTVKNATARYKLLPNFFNSAMDGFRYVLRPFKYWSQDEYKHFLEFSDPSSSCNHITLGVGGSWDGEKALRRKYPQCKMLGVDPVESLSRAVVESDPNSRFVRAAVGELGKKYDAHIKSVNKVDGYAKKEEFPHRALTELLMNENEGRTVDFMTIDVEGAEFGLLRVLNQKRAELPVICQFNVEVHYADQRYGVSWDEVDKTLHEMIDEAYWVLLNVDQREFQYRRLFFFNIGAEECIFKFLC